eukprot:3324968-Rhodomonas_salina.1
MDTAERARREIGQGTSEDDAQHEVALCQYLTPPSKPIAPYSCVSTGPCIAGASVLDTYAGTDSA